MKSLREVHVRVFKFSKCALIKYVVFQPCGEVDSYMFTVPIEDLSNFLLTIKKEVYDELHIYEEKSYFEKEGQEDIQKGQ